MNFEKKLGDLEKIVEAMEEGNLSLDESLKKFEQLIVNFCASSKAFPMTSNGIMLDNSACSNLLQK